MRSERFPSWTQESACILKRGCLILTTNLCSFVLLRKRVWCQAGVHAGVRVWCQAGMHVWCQAGMLVWCQAGVHVWCQAYTSMVPS